MPVSLRIGSLLPLAKPPRDRRQLQEFQEERMRELVCHAYRHVRYYRELFDSSSFHPSDFRSLSDLQKIPTSTKQDLQILPPEKLVDRRYKIDKLVCRRTTGSTGIPFKVRCSWFEDRLLSTYALQTWSLFGFGLGTRMAKVKIVGQGSDLPETMRVLSRLGIFGMRMIHSLQEPDVVCRALREYRPDVIVGYPGFLSHLAADLDESDREAINPRFLIAGGETMTPSMRRQIEAGFGARVYESYGSHEFHLIAAECPETGLLHVNERTVLLEVLNGDGEVGSGQGGETVITALHSFTQPFIRFRLGDWVERGPAPCPCGLPWATLKRVEGRKVDWIKLPGGDSIPPERLCMALSMTMPWIKQYQIIQENRESLLVKVVPFEPPRQSEIEQLSRALSEFVRGELRCSFEFVDHIPLGPAGKFQLCRSACHSKSK